MRLTNISAKSWLTLALVLIALAIVAIGYLLTGKHGSNSQAVAKSQQAEIDITDQGFVPASLSVDPGTTVTWVNKTSSPHRVSANPYPSREELPDLNSEVVAPDGSYSFIFKSSGDYGYQDYLHPTVSGTISVK